MAASIGRTDEQIEPLWEKLLEHYEQMMEAARGIDCALMAANSNSEVLRQEGVVCPEATPLPPQYAYKYPTLARQKTRPISNLVSELGGFCYIADPWLHGEHSVH